MEEIRSREKRVGLVDGNPVAETCSNKCYTLQGTPAPSGVEGDETRITELSEHNISERGKLLQINLVCHGPLGPSSKACLL